MRAAGQALALDPESREAAALVTRLMLEPPREVPHAVAAKLAADDAADSRYQARISLVMVVVMLATLAVYTRVGVLDWTAYGASLALVVALFGSCVQVARGRARWSFASLVLAAALVATLTRVASSFVVIPALATGTAVTFIAHPVFLRRPWLVVAAFTLAFGAPVALEVTGAIAPTWSFTGDTLIVRPTAAALATASLPMMIIANALLVSVIPLFMRALAVEAREGKRRLELHAWHLRQLLPSEPVNAP